MNDKSTFYITLQAAIERSKGAATWSDVLLAIQRARESKVRESLASIVSNYTLEELAAAEEVAWAVVRNQPAAPKVPAPAPPPPAPTTPPVAIDAAAVLAAKPKQQKRK